MKTISVLTGARLVTACFLAGVVCGCLLPGVIPSSSSSEPEITPGNPATERVEYFRHLVLRKGWQPVGYIPVSAEKARDDLNVFVFKYRGDELEAVFKGDGEQLVYTHALVLDSEITPYGAGPFVIPLVDGQPRLGRSFTTTVGEPEYYARFDEDGNLAEYQAVRRTVEGQEVSSLRCTYNALGLLSRLETIGEDEVGVHLRLTKTEYYYDENACVALRVLYSPDVTEAMLTESILNGRSHELTLVKRFPDGSYRVQTYFPASSGWSDWERADEMPVSLRKYISDVPVPTGGSKY